MLVQSIAVVFPYVVVVSRLVKIMTGLRTNTKFFPIITGEQKNNKNMLKMSLPERGFA